MSPLLVRRYRAERLLRKEFEAMRGRVLASVRARLLAAGVSLDAGDLEGCYSQAWHGLYTTMLEGQGAEIANPEGWLALVTYRRAIDEHRARLRTPGAYAATQDSQLDSGAPERDLASELDDRARLRQLMEGLHARLGPRERQAAALCYLQGLSRADAAARMGIGESRMRKLMDGPRAGTPGVAGKVGELLDTIRAGSYCAEQSSLMRGFAFGIHDPDGERYALAVAHQRECPACRAHVLSLRGLASVLPPLPLPLALGTSVAAGVGAGAGAGAGAGSGAGATGAGAGASTGAGVGAGAVTGSGWLVAGGGMTAKLAIGCLVAAGVGAGCVALTVAPIGVRPDRPHPRELRHHARGTYAPDADVALGLSAVDSQLASGGEPSAPAWPSRPAFASGARSASALTSAARVTRELGLEQPPRRGSTGGVSTTSTVASSGVARAAAAGTSTPQLAPHTQAQPAAPSRTNGGSSAAAREFGLG